MPWRTESQFILAWRSGGEPGNDTPYLKLGDVGFDGQGGQEGDLIPPVRRGGNLVEPSRQARRVPLVSVKSAGRSCTDSAERPAWSYRL